MISPECDRYDHAFCYGCDCPCHVPVQEPFKIVEKNDLAYAMPMSWVIPVFSSRQIGENDLIPCHYHETPEHIEYYQQKDIPKGYRMVAGLLGGQDAIIQARQPSKGGLSNGQWILQQIRLKPMTESEIGAAARSVNIDLKEIPFILDALLKHGDIYDAGGGKFSAISA